MAEHDLNVLLATMEPVLHPDAYGCAVSTGSVLPITPTATVAEAEGLTVIALGAPGPARGEMAALRALTHD